jgi:hypothetical protein
MPDDWQHREGRFEQTVLNLWQTLWVNGCLRRLPWAHDDTALPDGLPGKLDYRG